MYATTEIRCVSLPGMTLYNSFSLLTRSWFEFSNSVFTIEFRPRRVSAYVAFSIAPVGCFGCFEVGTPRVHLVI